MSGMSNLLLIRRCTQLDINTPQDTTSAAAYTLRLLARRILALTDEIRDLEHQITTTVTSHTPRLLTRRGIGPDNAAALLIAAGDNPDRLRSEASFAALCGVSPLEASSGRTSRRRLDRGGASPGQTRPPPPHPRRRPPSKSRPLPHRPTPPARGPPPPRLPRPPH